MAKDESASARTAAWAERAQRAADLERPRKQARVDDSLDEYHQSAGSSQGLAGNPDLPGGGPGAGPARAASAGLNSKRSPSSELGDAAAELGPFPVSKKVRTEDALHGDDQMDVEQHVNMLIEAVDVENSNSEKNDENWF